MAMRVARVFPIATGIVGLGDPDKEVPQGLFASSEGFEAWGTCHEIRSAGCFISFFDYEDGQVREYLMSLDDATSLPEYVKLLED
jgi:hypothetical protein